MQYAEDWKDCETVNPLRFGKEFDIKSYAKYIIENRDELERKALIDLQDCLRLLRYDKVSKTRCPNGIGIVYLITIMFFWHMESNLSMTGWL